MVQEQLYELYIPVIVRLPYAQGQLIAAFHEAGQVERIEHERGGVLIQGRIPGRLIAQYREWEKTSDEPVNNEYKENP
jgi:GTP-binding protein HflX